MHEFIFGAKGRVPPKVCRSNGETSLLPLSGIACSGVSYAVLKSDPSPFVFLLRCYFLRRDTSSIPIGTTTFPNQLPEALLSANVGALGVLLGEPSHASLNQNRNVSRHTGAG